MARIAGVNIPSNKKVEFALTYIFGIGLLTSKKVCEAARVDVNKRVHALSDDEVIRLREAIGAYEVEGELRRRYAVAIKRLKDIKCYRGTRHIDNLPVHGQRTRSNARTRKGKSKGPIAGKKKVTK